MKVLFVAPYIYKKEYPEFTRNLTGLGLMVEDILEEVAKTEDVSLFSLVITEGHGSILKHSWGDVLKNARFRDVAAGIKLFAFCNQAFKGRCKSFYYGINRGAFRAAIKKEKPDIVHIHSLSSATNGFIEECKKLNIPFVVTLHGLVGLDESVKAPKWDKELEPVFLKEALKDGTAVTVISTGMKRRIEKEYLSGETADNIFVVCNGTKISATETAFSAADLRMEFGITDEEKVVAVIGSLCERKNQVQVVRAFATGRIDTPCKVLFCGNDVTGGEVDRLISENGLENKLLTLGFLPKEKVSSILNMADVNVVASRDEGFGLSMIEGFVHGVPTVTFADLDALPDLYDERAMLTSESRNDRDFADAIEKALCKNWNREQIKEYGKQFSLSETAQKYIEVYKMVTGS